MDSDYVSDPALAAAITRQASKQTYYTVRFLVDRDRVDDAYRAYAYFRWVDDTLDSYTLDQPARLAFLGRQEALMRAVYAGNTLTGLTREERFLADLVRRDPDPQSGLYAYISNLMSVMAFDAERRGRLVSRLELKEYTHRLAAAVTEALHYFVGHRCEIRASELRYRAAAGAHIVHMLRDTVEDIRLGYYNIPRELVQGSGIDPQDIKSDVYRMWVELRARQARACFLAGRVYLRQVPSLRCRLAAYAYIRRFEQVLSCIERERYLLRAAYAEHDGPASKAEAMAWSFWMALGGSGRTAQLVGGRMRNAG